MLVFLASFATRAGATLWEWIATGRLAILWITLTLLTNLELQVYYMFINLCKCWVILLGMMALNRFFFYSWWRNCCIFYRSYQDTSQWSLRWCLRYMQNCLLLLIVSESFTICSWQQLLIIIYFISDVKRKKKLRGTRRDWCYCERRNKRRKHPLLDSFCIEHSFRHARFSNAKRTLPIHHTSRGGFISSHSEKWGEDREGGNNNIVKSFHNIRAFLTKKISWS